MGAASRAPFSFRAYRAYIALPVHWLKARRSFDHFGHEIQPVAHGRRGTLELFTVYLLCNNVVSQTQLSFLDLLDRMRKRFDTGGIHGLHLLDETEEVVQPRKRGFGLVLGQFEPREVRNAFYIGQGQGHSITGFFSTYALTKSATAIRDKGALKSRLVDGKMYRPFPSNTPKL